MTQEEQDEKVLREAVDRLAEQFDTVQVLCTRHQDRNTRAWDRGAGNIYARLEHARDFLTRDRARTDEIERMELRGENK
jgi:hypothetical protein